MKFTTHLELHSQTTRLVEGGSHGHRTEAIHGILTLHDVLFTRNLNQGHTRTHLYRLQCGCTNAPAFKSELLPLHSPLLRQSLLVSFPPLIDMLKFSGYPYPISGQICQQFCGFFLFWKYVQIIDTNESNILSRWNETKSSIHPWFYKGQNDLRSAATLTQSRHGIKALPEGFLLTLRRACPTE
jgi:hypothetical protein